MNQNFKKNDKYFEENFKLQLYLSLTFLLITTIKIIVDLFK